ncbi:MAG: class I SAM-dependent methyltransferase [Chloroflexota bacterium]
MDNKDSVREQFGIHAKHYINSKPHAKGASLNRLVEVVKPQKHWQMLDIATATGHTAMTFAPFVDQVIASDITPEMLPLADEQAQKRGLENVTTEIADAESLPYENDRFDLVTCRIAPHHFPNVDQFLSESARVLKSGGIFALVDNVVPEGPDGTYANDFEKLRDPSHHRCLSLAEWLAGFEQVNLTVLHQEILDKEMEFASWAGRHDEAMQQRLRTLLLEAPEGAKRFFQPHDKEGGLYFRLEEALIVGKLT